MTIRENLLPAYERSIQLLVKVGRLAEASQLAQTAIEQSDPNVELYYLAGVLAGTQEDWYRASLYFSEVLNLAPNHLNAHLHFIRSMIAQDRTAEAREAYERAEDTQPTTRAFRGVRCSIELASTHCYCEFEMYSASPL